MSNLIETLQMGDTKTTNGMTTNSTTLNECVNLFFTIGAMRGSKKNSVLRLFSKAFVEDPLTATKILFWVRDVRGGAGERQIFRDIINYLGETQPELVKKNIHLIPEYGRWDDLFGLMNTPVENNVINLIVDSLNNNEVNSLLAKWLPRKGVVFNRLRKTLNLKPKELRKMLVGLSNSVEQKMCAKEWETIEYSKVPSLAISRYNVAFTRNDETRYLDYLDSLKNGETKVNVGAVYPYDIIKTLKRGKEATLANEQWNSLPNFMEGCDELILPMVDVSASMGCSVGGNPNLTCMDVAISLGMYISERNEGDFKDMFMTFSSNPQIQKLMGTLEQRYRQLSRAEWGMSTNLEMAFKTLLNQAIKFDIPQEGMPSKVLILSDMEFDSATSESWNTEPTWDPTAMSMIDDLYTDAGYTRPGIIFWNLNASDKNFPVRFNNEGVALISGFSPSILKSLLSNPNSLTPINIMLETINNERYSNISI
jgi:hypothetical protein